MSSIKIFLLFFLLSFSAVISAQQSDSTSVKTHGEWVERIFTVMDMQMKISDDDREWLKSFLAQSCQCVEIKEKTAQEKCQLAVFGALGLPTSEEGFASMDAEQRHKFMLLSPLASMFGSCPEHE